MIEHLQNRPVHRKDGILRGHRSGGEKRSCDTQYHKTHVVDR